MNTYTIQQSAQSGETFVIQWDGDRATGICGPLDPFERDQAVRDIRDAGSFEYEPFQGDDSPNAWQFPIASHDPGTGETWRTL